MKRDMIFICLLAASAAIFLLDLAYLIFAACKTAFFVNGIDLSVDGLIAFSITAAVLNLLLAGAAAAYFIFKKLSASKQDKLISGDK